MEYKVQYKGTESKWKQSSQLKMNLMTFHQRITVRHHNCSLTQPQPSEQVGV